MIWIEKSLILLSGRFETDLFVDEHNFSIFDDIALSLVYKTPIPNEQQIIELKQKLMENYNENSQADSYINGMNKEIIKYT